MLCRYWPCRGRIDTRRRGNRRSPRRARRMPLCRPPKRTSGSRTGRLPSRTRTRPPRSARSRTRRRPCRPRPGGHDNPRSCNSGTDARPYRRWASTFPGTRRRWCTAWRGCRSTTSRSSCCPRWSRRRPTSCRRPRRRCRPHRTEEDRRRDPARTGTPAPPRRRRARRGPRPGLHIARAGKTSPEGISARATGTGSYLT